MSHPITGLRLQRFRACLDRIAASDQAWVDQARANGEAIDDFLEQRRFLPQELRVEIDFDLNTILVADSPPYPVPNRHFAFTLGVGVLLGQWLWESGEGLPHQPISRAALERGMRFLFRDLAGYDAPADSEFVSFRRFERGRLAARRSSHVLGRCLPEARGCEGGHQLRPVLPDTDKRRAPGGRAHRGTAWVDQARASGEAIDDLLEQRRLLPRERRLGIDFDRNAILLEGAPPYLVPDRLHAFTLGVSLLLSRRLRDRAAGLRHAPLYRTDLEAGLRNVFQEVWGCAPPVDSELVSIRQFERGLLAVRRSEHPLGACFPRRPGCEGGVVLDPGEH